MPECTQSHPQYDSLWCSHTRLQVGIVHIAKRGSCPPRFTLATDSPHVKHLVRVINDRLYNCQILESISRVEKAWQVLFLQWYNEYTKSYLYHMTSLAMSSYLLQVKGENTCTLHLCNFVLQLQPYVSK